MARTTKGRPLRSTRPARAGGEKRRAQLEHTSPTPAGTADALDARFPKAALGELAEADLQGDENRSVAQQGGSRGTSSRNGPDREGARNSRSAVAGSDEREQNPQNAGGTDDPIRGPLPEGATREDYVGGEAPHKTREVGGTRTHASRKRNEVL